jgi:hypothetical protein
LDFCWMGLVCCVDDHICGYFFSTGKIKNSGGFE